MKKWRTDQNQAASDFPRVYWNLVRPGPKVYRLTAPAVIEKVLLFFLGCALQRKLTNWGASKYEKFAELFVRQDIHSKKTPQK